MRPRRRGLWLALGALLIVLVIGLVAGLRVASQGLQAAVLGALGPRASVGEVSISWRGVVVNDLRIRSAGGKAWPAADELRAERVRVVPSLRSLFMRGWHIASIEVDTGYVSLFRSRDGKLHVLPALLRPPAPGKARAASAPAAETGVQVGIGEIVLKDAAVELYDASVRQPPLKLRLQSLDAQVGPLDLPTLDSRTDIELDAVVKGVQRDGTIKLRGGIVLANHDSDLDARLAGVDLVALQPYLVKVSEAGVKRGTLDLRLRSTVKNNQLRAPGELTLTGLELADSGSLLGSFAGVPRAALLGFLSHNDRIDVSFTLEGRLDDPGFSLNENFATRTASALADKLGVSLGGVVEGVGGVIKGLFGR